MTENIWMSLTIISLVLSVWAIGKLLSVIASSEEEKKLLKEIIQEIQSVKEDVKNINKCH